VTISIGFGLVLFNARISPALGVPRGGPRSSPFYTTISDELGNQLVIHAVRQATPTHSSNITQFPVAKGAKITDHIRAEPMTLVMECVVTNTPVSGVVRTVFNRGMAIDSSTEEDHIQGDPGLAEEAYQWLVAQQLAGALLTVSRRRATYTNMAIKNVSEAETAANGEALVFNITLQEIHFAEEKKVVSKVSLSKLQKKGKVPPKPAAPPPDIDPARQVAGLFGGK
jgi:hypothetical protein